MAAIKSGDYARDKGGSMGTRFRPEDQQYDLYNAKAMGLKKASKTFSPVRDAHRAPLYRRPI